MKKHIVFSAALVTCLFLLNSNLFSRSIVGPNPRLVDVYPEKMMVDPMPEPIEAVEFVEKVTERVPGQQFFDFGAIKLKSAGLGKCVGITLVPSTGKKVQVRAQRFTKSFWGSAPKPGKVLSKWIKVGPGGMRVKYDRAGGGQDYYKVFCRVQSGAGRVDCRDVLRIEDVKPGHCWSGPGSTDASFAPLNMTIKNK